MARVQVQDLEAPQRIQPAGYQSDTYAPPAPPPLDNNAERLAQALGGFSSTLARVGRRMEEDDKKKRLEQIEADWNRYLTSMTPGEALDAVRLGQAPHQADPLSAAVIDTWAGRQEALAFARALDEDLRANPQLLGSEGFQVDEYVKGRVAEFIKDGRLKSNFAIKAFRTGLDSVRENLSTQHANALGKANVERIETAASSQLKLELFTALDAGLDADQMAQYLHKVYKDLGPRVSGGSLDLKYARLDELLIQHLKVLATDPRYAARAEQILSMQRIDSGTGMRVGALADVDRLKDDVKAVRTTAWKTLADEQEARTKGAAVEAAKAALIRRDGTFSRVPDVNENNPWSASPISMDAKAVQQEAIQGVLDDLRAGKQGIDLDAEMEVMIKNNISHPDLIPMLKSQATAMLTAVHSQNGARVDMAPQFIEAANQYKRFANRNREYMVSHLGKRETEIFDTYWAHIEVAKQRPEEAYAILQRHYSMEQKDPNLDSRNRAEIATQVRAYDSNGWLPGGGINSWFGKVTNGAEVERRVAELATIFMRTGAMTAQEAIEAARPRIEAEGVVVNGRVIFGTPGYNPGDGPYVEQVIQKKFDDPKIKEALLKQGYTDASELSIVPYGNGMAHVVDHAGNPILVPTERNKRGEPLLILTPDVQKLRADTEAAVEAEQNRKNVERNKAIQQGINPNAPHNLLRGLFGAPPIKDTFQLMFDSE